MTCKSEEERSFYIHTSVKERWSKRELERQIASATFERTMLANEKLSKRPQDVNSNLASIFKDSYVLEFLNLPAQHDENQFQNAIVANLKNFILEFGRDFAFMGQEYKIQVGNQDFFIDLLFYHRTLQCLVALELKTARFAPEHLAQINFYLEALDRDIKNERENPSIGILLCKGKDDVVVEYALSRALNPAMVADYQLALPNKKLLHDKWQEILEMNEKERIEL
jgi:predicted nuclease of restriction endonuclease-like (RecB) superfamily